MRTTLLPFGLAPLGRVGCGAQLVIAFVPQSSSSVIAMEGGGGQGNDLAEPGASLAAFWQAHRYLRSLARPALRPRGFVPLPWLPSGSMPSVALGLLIMVAITGMMSKNGTFGTTGSEIIRDCALACDHDFDHDCDHVDDADCYDGCGNKRDDGTGHSRFRPAPFGTSACSQWLGSTLNAACWV